MLDDRFDLTFASKVYPVKKKDFGLTQGTLKVIYGRGLRRRLGGLGRIVRSLF